MTSSFLFDEKKIAFVWCKKGEDFPLMACAHLLQSQLIRRVQVRRYNGYSSKSMNPPPALTSMPQQTQSSKRNERREHDIVAGH